MAAVLPRKLAQNIVRAWPDGSSLQAFLFFRVAYMEKAIKKARAMLATSDAPWMSDVVESLDHGISFAHTARAWIQQQDVENGTCAKRADMWAKILLRARRELKSGHGVPKTEHEWSKIEHTLKITATRKKIPEIYTSATELGVVLDQNAAASKAELVDAFAEALDEVPRCFEVHAFRLFLPHGLH